MEGYQRIYERSVKLLLAVMLGLGTGVLVGTLNVLADEPGSDPPALFSELPKSPTMTVTTRPDGVWIQIANVQTIPGAPPKSSSGPASATANAAAPACAYTLDAVNIGPYSRNLLTERPGYALYLVVPTCGGDTIDMIWLPIDVNLASVRFSAPPLLSSPGRTPTSIAEEIVRNLPVPGLAVQANPRPGMVNVPTWFWLDYDGAPLTKTVEAFGVVVRVLASPREYKWEFGDGSSLVTHSRGKPYPTPSDVQHIYQRSTGAYTVTANLVFDIQFSVNGGPPQALPPLVRSASAQLPVQQMQAVLVR